MRSKIKKIMRKMLKKKRLKKRLKKLIIIILDTKFITTVLVSLIIIQTEFNHI